MLSLAELKNILDDPDPRLTEDLARQAHQMTTQYFGRTVSLYAPLYLSNYCSSRCTYCGFHSHHRIRRFKLTIDEMSREMAHIAESGIENILLLTGESYTATPLSYLQTAVEAAKHYFPNIGLEVHPMAEEEYRALFLCGVDGITVYQETYDRRRYKAVHLAGKKADYDYRYNTPERAAKGGIRQIAMGILLGLADAAEDLYALWEHLRWMEQHFPGVEYSVSFPRLRPVRGENFAVCDVNDAAMVKIIALTRIHFPRVGINLSTREAPRLRDNALELGITRLSAGSNTSVGGYTVTPDDEQNPQFDIRDHRSVKEIILALKKRHFDPVLTDWRRI